MNDFKKQNFAKPGFAKIAVVVAAFFVLLPPNGGNNADQSLGTLHR